MSVQDVIESGGGRVVAFVAESAPGALPGAVFSEAEYNDSDLLQSARVVVGIGDCRARLAVHNSIDPGLIAPAVIAPSATVASLAGVGVGTVIHHHAHVGPRAVVGAAVIVNTGAIVEHDCVVEDGVHIAPGAVVLGAARIGKSAFIGSGARVLPGIAVGAEAVIGAGAIVTRNVPNSSIVVGIPARLLER